MTTKEPDGVTVFWVKSISEWSPILATKEEADDWKTMIWQDNPHDTEPTISAMLVPLTADGIATHMNAMWLQVCSRGRAKN